MKTLVIHPDDRTTDFLSQIYEGRDWTIENRHKHEITWVETYNLIKEHDRIIIMGHGYPGGLFYTHIDPAMSSILRQKDCVCIWCNADQYVQKHGLKGFYTGMFISEVGEANWFQIKTTQEKIDYSNQLFTRLVAENIDDEQIHSIVKESYVGDDPVIQFNNDRLYYRDEESILADKDLNDELKILRG